MTGFLQRLAKQANGTARTARVSTGSLLASSPAPNEAFSGQVLSERATPFPSNDDHQINPAQWSDEAFPTSPETLSPEVQRVPGANDAPATNSFSNVAPIVAHNPKRPNASPVAATTPDGVTPDYKTVPAKGTATKGWRPATEHDPLASQPEAESRPNLASSNKSVAPDHRASSASPADLSDIPTLLAPFSQTSKPSVSGSGLEPQRAADGGSRQDTNEVHIHIGRIEVTAVHESPSVAPARARRSGQQPLSLDDYLAKRRNGKA